MDPRKAKTNWPAFFWPIAFLWLASALCASWFGFDQGGIGLLIVLMMVSALAVALVHAVVGTLFQDKYDRQHFEESATCCAGCGRSDVEFRTVEYETCLFFLVFAVMQSAKQKLCRSCAEVVLSTMFRKTVWGSILFPPIILLAWLKKRRILASYKSRSGAQPMRAG